MDKITLYVQKIRPIYPELAINSANFYRSTFALLQALYGLRDSDHASFEDGISEYV